MVIMRSYYEVNALAFVGPAHEVSMAISNCGRGQSSGTTRVMLTIIPTPREGTLKNYVLVNAPGVLRTKQLIRESGSF